MRSALYDLLMNQGVYGRVKEAKASDFAGFRGSSGFKTLDLYCPTCKENKTFIFEDDRSIEGLGTYKIINYIDTCIKSLVYKCPSCENNLFYLIYFNGNEIIKLAQYPSLYDVRRDELKKYQKNDLIDKENFAQLYKAEECASIGYYIAAYTYMRRVYETLLFSVFIQNKNEIGISENDFRKLHSDKKLKAIKDYLAIDDEIYLPLYGLLSADIHVMSEEQCSQDFAVLKHILLEILAEQKAMKEKASKRKELKDLFSNRKGEIK